MEARASEMIITLRNSLGRELMTYRSYVVPRAKEHISVSIGSDSMRWKVMGVEYQVRGEQGDTVDLEVLPVNDAARDHASSLSIVTESIR